MTRTFKTSATTVATMRQLAATLFALVVAFMLMAAPGAGKALASPQTAPSPDHVVQPSELVGKWSPDADSDQPHYLEVYYSKGHLVYFYYRMVYGPGTGGTKANPAEFEYNHGYLALQGNHGTCLAYNTAGTKVYHSYYVDQASKGVMYDQETGQKLKYVGKAGSWRSWLNWPTKPACYDATTGATASGKTSTGTTKQEAKVKVGNLAATEIGSMNARLSATAYKTPAVNVSTCGLYLGTSEGTMQKCNTENVGSATNNYRNGNSFDIWYDLNNELGIRLMSGTKYYYQFYCVSGGVEYRSGVGTFTTK